MNEEKEREKIRDVIQTWMRATREGNLEQILSLMAEGVVYLRTGEPPMRGRDAFAATTRAAFGKVRIEGKSEIREIQIAEGYA